MDKSRYESLDFLRGICALSIMIYHYTGWTFGHYAASNVIGRIGVYGVSMFYVLSGLTMYLVYYKNFTFSKTFFLNFYIKRFFRIYPLMWFVIIISYIIIGTKNNCSQQLIIASGLFSVFDWSASTPLGMWSIGNELSFYLLLPFIFIAFKTNKIIGFMLSSLFFFIYIYFAFYKFNPLIEGVSEDLNYKNPLNQAALFVGGILIGYFFKEKQFKPVFINILCLVGLLLFCYYPCNGELRNTYLGINRLVFTFICFIITLGFFKIEFNYVSNKIKGILSWLGEISYSLYLMHGLVWSIVLFTGIKIRYILPISFILSFLVSHFIYKFLESPARNFGYKLLKNNKPTIY
jgi:exopolysaccharide production protein ExoZ